MRKYIIYFIVLFCCVHISCHSQTLYLQEKDNLYGYVDSSGKTIIPFEYSFAFTDTFTTIAFVAYDSKIKAIDRNNNRLFTVYNYDNGPDEAKEGLFRIVDDEDGLMGFANMEGKIIIPPTYYFIQPFHNGLAAFNEGGREESLDSLDNYSIIIDGKWGFIDAQENIVFPAIFDHIYFPANNKIEVIIGERTFSIEENK